MNAWFRRLLVLLFFLGLWLVIVRSLNAITFTPAMTEALIAITSSLGIYGNEAIEDAYLVVTGAVATVVAAIATSFLSLASRRVLKKR